VSGPPAADGPGVGADRSMTFRLGEFAWETIQQESARLGVSPEDLVSFAVLYYVADVDSGRISRRISQSPHPDTSQ